MGARTGAGTLRTWTVVRLAFVNGFETPYILAEGKARRFILESGIDSEDPDSFAVLSAGGAIGKGREMSGS